MLLIFFFILLYIIILLLNSNECKVYVQLSAANLNYLTYLPIVVKAWSRIGYCSIVFIVFHNLSKEIIYIQKQLKQLKSNVVLLKMNESISLHYVSKLARIYGFMIKIQTRKYNFFYLSDTDIVPISKKYFEDMKYNKLTIKSFGKKGYGFGNNKGRWAMCYMVANKNVWYDILKKDITSNDIKIIVANIIKAALKQGEKYYDGFQYIDEVYMRDRIKIWRNFNSQVLFKKRNYINTRIARNELNLSFYANNSAIIDIHLPKLNKNIKSMWKNKLIPLQQYLFNYIPYNMEYINSVFS